MSDLTINQPSEQTLTPEPLTAGRLQLQPASPAELPRVLAMMQAYYAYDDLEYTPAVEAAVTDLLSRPHDGRVWLIMDGPQSVGYAVVTFWYSLEFQGKAAFLDEIYLEESVRGQGLGGDVIEALATLCRSLDIKTLRLEVEHENTRAQRAYEKSGFITHPRHLMTKWL